MKKLALLALTLSAVLSSTVTFAQSASVPPTKALVRINLSGPEQAGYNQSANEDATYLADIQSAEQKLAAQDAEPQAASPKQEGSDSGTGAAMTGTSDASHNKKESHPSDPSACVGPVSYCNIFFGS